MHGRIPILAIFLEKTYPKPMRDTPVLGFLTTDLVELNQGNTNLVANIHEHPKIHSAGKRAHTWICGS